MAKKTKTPVDDWAHLSYLINTLVEAAIEDFGKGGGDPEDRPVIEADLKAAQVRLDSHLEKMEREYTSIKARLREHEGPWGDDANKA